MRRVWGGEGSCREIQLDLLLCVVNLLYACIHSKWFYSILSNYSKYIVSLCICLWLPHHLFHFTLYLSILLLASAALTRGPRVSSRYHSGFVHPAITYPLAHFSSGSDVPCYALQV